MKSNASQLYRNLKLDLNSGKVMIYDMSYDKLSLYSYDYQQFIFIANRVSNYWTPVWLSLEKRKERNYDYILSALRYDCDYLCSIIRNLTIYKTREVDFNDYFCMLESIFVNKILPYYNKNSLYNNGYAMTIKLSDNKLDKVYMSRDNLDIGLHFDIKCAYVNLNSFKYTLRFCDTFDMCEKCIGIIKAELKNFM